MKINKTLITAALAAFIGAGTSGAAITQNGAWALGEAGSVSGSGTQLPFVDSINSAQNITANQAGGSPTIVAPTGSGMLAPGSTAALQFAVPGSQGWFGNTTGFNLSSDWGIELYVNNVSGGGGTLMQTDNSTGGVSLRAGNGTFSFGTGGGGASTIVGSTAVTNNTWAKIDIIRFGTTNTYYVNNTLVFTASAGTGNGSFLNAPMLMFGQGGTGGYSGTAQIDQMGTWAFSSASGDTLSQVQSAMGITAVPEPSTYGLMGAGALAAVAFVRRRKKKVGIAA